MTDTATETRTVTVEREMPFPPEKIWRALTQPHLLEEWLMQGDFAPVVGHHFNFRGDWGSVACEVLELEPHRALSYSWNGFDLESVVTWTLTPAGAGTRLRMEHSGFQAEHEQAYQGATMGWARFFGTLEQLLARLD